MVKEGIVNDNDDSEPSVHERNGMIPMHEKNEAAIGSLALDTARSHQDEQLEKYGMDVLTVAFLAILITAPIGALVIGLAGPRLLQKAQTNSKEDEEGAEVGEEAEACEPS